MTMISKFLFNFINFCVIFSFVDEITSTKYFIFKTIKSSFSGYVSNTRYFTLPLTSIILALRVVLVVKLVILGTSPVSSFC